MKKIFKKFCSIFFCCVFLLYSTSFTVNARNINQSLKSINTIAKNFAINTIKWNDVELYNVKQLYNFNNKLVAYSIDIKNNKNGLLGYEIVSTNFKENRVLEFSKNKRSPYSEVKNGYKCIYEGFLNYYYENEATIYDIKSKTVLNEKDVTLLKSEDENKSYKLIQDSEALNKNRVLSLSNVNKTKKVLSDVPDEIWNKGCVPTAVAMVLEYDYYNYVPVYDELTQKLAVAMGTDNKGNTYNNKIIDGIKSVMKNLGVDVWTKADEYGKNNSTYDKFVNEINNNHPVVVNLVNSKETSRGYSNGFGNHSCAGIGYEYNDTEKFIIVHDDCCDGEVYCDFNSSALGNNQWIYIH